MKKLLLLIVSLVSINQTIAQADAFIATWVTDTGFETLTLPAQPDASNYTINWGDGSTNTYTSTQVPSHLFINSGEHTISFTGTFTHLIFEGQAKLKAVQQWGNSKWTSMEKMFKDCTNLNSFPTQAPHLSLCTSMSYMFYNASSFNQPIGSWDVSNVTNMSEMFRGATAFNQPIDSWDVSKVTDMSFMFRSAASFNQPIDSWDVSKVTDMSFMFRSASAFNQPIGSWDVSKVKDMRYMFVATTFNQPIGDWNVSNVTDMSYMFYNAASFNQPIDSWDVSNVTNMRFMFSGATSFNQDISNWCVSNISSEPTNFSNYSPLTEENKPVWGTCPALGVDDQNLTNISIFPNPVDDKLFIQGVLDVSEISIYDVLGKLVLSKTASSEIDVTNLKKGIYIIKIVAEQKETIQKFIKN
jgi:surface protein